EKDDPDGPSDTKNFVDQVLIPYTASMDFGGGAGDIQNEHYKKLINKFWPASSNRGVLIASDNPAFFIDSWKEISDGDGDKFLASNDDYFDKVIRGPEHERRLVREEEEKKRTVVSKTADRTVAQLSEFDWEDRQH